MNGQTQASEDGCGQIFALICSTFCKDSPLAEAFGANNDNSNNNNQNTPLLSPITNGEIFFGHDDDSQAISVLTCLNFFRYLQLA